MILVGLFTLAMGIILSSIPWLDYIIFKVGKRYLSDLCHSILSMLRQTGLNFTKDGKKLIHKPAVIHSYYPTSMLLIEEINSYVYR